MTRLDVQRLLPRTDVVLRTPPNWTAIGFFAVLSGLHWFIAFTAFLHQRWEGFMSVIFACTFAAISVACSLVCCELKVQAADKRLRLRTGTRRLYTERFVPFTSVRSVRLTLLHPRAPESARIELVCDHEVIDCPPTAVPREEALCLALTIGVQLIKVYGDAFGPVSERRDQLHLN